MIQCDWTIGGEFKILAGQSAVGIDGKLPGGCGRTTGRVPRPASSSHVMESTSDWDGIFPTMDFQQQSQYSPMDVVPAKSWCFSNQNNRPPSLMEERSRIGSPASSPCSTSKHLPPLHEWFLDDQKNFLPPVEDDETTLIASPHSQQLQQPVVDFFDIAQMAERLASLENSMAGLMGLTRKLRVIDRKISKLNRDMEKLSSNHNKLLPWTLDVNDAVHNLATVVARSATNQPQEST
ncbi:hypothetical protein V492_00246 [Pseudogymnoascus sp. VKM F-4246]|nr:hypothetical protein V492_00246 [Pseudogymnoascus sp. VKM F-4246]